MIDVEEGVPKKLTKRQMKALIKRFLNERAVGGDGRLSIASLNGCVVYRGGRNEPICKNMSKADCERLSLELQTVNSQYFARPLIKPCERIS